MSRTLATAPIAILLGVLLLLSQHAGLRHGLSHLPGHADEAATAHGDHGGSEPEGHAPGEACPDCLAFAQIDAAIHAAVAPPALLCGMRFHIAASPAMAAQDAACPAQRSRGPPSFV